MSELKEGPEGGLMGRSKVKLKLDPGPGREVPLR